MPQRERPAKLGYVPALDGIRALAIAPVVLLHAFHWPSGGVLGVHMFFVLSGFLITTLLMQEWNAKGSISLRHFYYRRALRLVPALVVMLAAYVVIQVARELVIEPQALDLSRALEAATLSGFYVSNILQGAGYVMPIPLVALWSLATEEQFYLLWPLLLLIALRFGLKRRVIQWSLVALIALTVAHRTDLSLTDASTQRLYYAPDMHFDMLVVGCVLGLWYASGKGLRPLGPPSFLAWSWIPAGAVVGTAIFIADNQRPEFYWGWLLPFAVATGVLILTAVQRPDSLLARALRLAPLVFLGKISYSLYLWHLLVIDFGRKVGVPSGAGVVITLVVATASYYLVELPFLRRKRRDRAKVEGRNPDRGEEQPTGMPEAPRRASADRSKEPPVPSYVERP